MQQGLHQLSILDRVARSRIILYLGDGRAHYFGDSVACPWTKDQLGVDAALLDEVLGEMRATKRGLVRQILQVMRKHEVKMMGVCKRGCLSDV